MLKTCKNCLLLSKFNRCKRINDEILSVKDNTIINPEMFKCIYHVDPLKYITSGYPEEYQEEIYKYIPDEKK